MKTCPLCRMEARNDADWCWHCGYSYEEAEARSGSPTRQESPLNGEAGPPEEDPL